MRWERERERRGGRENVCGGGGGGGVMGRGGEWGERQTDRQTDRDTERDRERQGETEREVTICVSSPVSLSDGKRHPTDNHWPVAVTMS